MVASQTAPRARAIAAGALVALMLMPALTFESAAQSNLFHDLSVRDASVRVLNATASGRPETHFVYAGQRIIVNFTVNNEGGAATSVPVWVTIQGVATGACMFRDFPAQSTQYFEWPLTLATNIADGRHNVSLVVNRAQPSGSAAAPNGYRQIDGNPCPTNGPRDGPLDGPTANDNDNTGAGFFVVNLKPNLAIYDVLWCRGRPGATAQDAACNDPRTNLTDGSGNVLEGPIDETHEPTTAEPDLMTRFRVEVINNGTYADMQGVPYVVNVTVRGHGINGVMNLTHTQVHYNGTAAEWSSVWWDTLPFDLTHKAGNYTVTAKILFGDDASAQDNTNTTLFNVRYSDFNASADADWRTNASFPYAYVDNTPISGNITFTNLGERAIPSVDWEVFIDGAPAFRDSGTYPPSSGDPEIAPGASFRIPISWTFITSTGQNFLRPGEHFVNAVIDVPDDVYELNEANNTLNFSIFIQDADAPVFNNTPAVKILNADDEVITSTNPHRPFRLATWARDDDQNAVSVRANFTNDDENITRFYNLTPTGADDGTYFTTAILDLPFIRDRNKTVTNWSLTVTARDAFGNNRTVSGGKLRMDVWPVHTVPVDYLVRNESDGANFTWASDDHPRFEVYLRYNMTGVRGQEEEAPNLKMNVTTPRGESFTVTEWSTVPCQITDGDDGLGNIFDPDEPSSCPDTGMFKRLLLKTAGSPGMWYANITVSDVSEMTRYVNRTFNVTDELPIFEDADVLKATVNASEPLNFTATVREDYERKDLRVYVNLTRNDGKTWNFSMGEGLLGSAINESVFFLNVTTGRNAMLDHGGEFNLTFRAVDFNNNWRVLPFGTIKVVDGAKPTILEAGAITLGDQQELDTPVVFYAKATDETNTTLELRVKPKTSSEIVIGPVNLTDDDHDDNWTYQVKFTNEGDYEWQIRAIDSVGQVSDPIATGPISIQRNLPPRIAVLSPSHFEGGLYYGTAKPRITIYLQDRDGIDNNTLTLKIDNKDAVFDLTRDAETSEYRLTARVDKTYLHGASIPVNLSVVDSSADLLPNWLNFTIVADAVAPVVRTPQFEPKYRANASDPWVVSLDTRFTLSAHDDDDIDATDIASIRYSVYRVGQFSPLYFWEGAPFRLSTLDRFTPLPGKYTMTVLAEDDVGNFNDPAYELDIVLDSAPPSIANFGEKPDGRDIRLTLRDATGVNRAVLYQKINSGAYEATPMTREGDVWSAKLAEGRKGDTISYYVQAWDHVENTATYGTPDEPYDTYLVPNHKPTLKILAPLQGDAVQRTTEARWESVDLDGDALTFKVLLRGATETSFDEIAKLESPGIRKYSFDTKAFPDGEYVLRIEVNDGSSAATADVTFTIRNAASAIGTVGGGGAEILPGEGLLVTAQITKANPITVEAHVYSGDALVGSFAMRDDGVEPDATANDRIYSALVKADAAGDYRVEIFTVYREDGLEKNDTAKNAAYFSVAMTPGYILTEYAPLVALVAIAAAVAIGVAGFFAFRKRR